MSVRERQRERDEGRFRDQIAAACEETIYPHVYGNSDREVGGVLYGRLPRVGSEDRMQFPLIVGAIEALRASEQRSSLTFTQDAWAIIHEKLDEISPKSKHEQGYEIVGWYHSHPGFGIFLSGHDMFIQENFFANPRQFALVVDPLANTEGVFIWGGEDKKEVVELYQEPVEYEFAGPAWEPPPLEVTFEDDELADLPRGGRDSADSAVIVLMYGFGLALGILVATLSGALI